MIWFKTWDQLRLLTKSCMIVASTGTRILDCLHRKSAPHISWRWDSHITSACGFWGGIWQILHPNPTTSYLYLHQDLRNYSPFQHFANESPSQVPSVISQIISASHIIKSILIHAVRPWRMYFFFVYIILLTWRTWNLQACLCTN